MPLQTWFLIWHGSSLTYTCKRHRKLPEEKQEIHTEPHSPLSFLYKCIHFKADSSVQITTDENRHYVTGSHILRFFIYSWYWNRFSLTKQKEVGEQIFLNLHRDFLTDPSEKIKASQSFFLVSSFRNVHINLFTMSGWSCCSQWLASDKMVSLK